MAKYFGQGFADKLGDLTGLPPEEREVVAYGLEYLLSGTIGLALMLLAGLAVGLFREALAVLSCWVLLRAFAGGAHCTALWRCVIVNCLCILAALLVTRGAALFLPAAAWVGVAVAWSLLAIGLWAPNNSEKPVTDPLRRGKLRRRALALVLVLGALLLCASLGRLEQGQALAVAGATGLAAGGFMLSPAGFKLISVLDSGLKHFGHLTGKGGEYP